MKRDLVDAYLQETRSESLSDYLSACLTEGMSWRKIAHHIYSDTNGVVDVSHETIRAWAGHFELEDQPHWVYRLYDEAGTLLYVGCTYLEPEQRVADLRNGNATVGRAPIHHWHADQYPNMVAGLAAEGSWIDDASPPLNRMRSGVAARRELDAIPEPIAQRSGVLGVPA